MKVTASSYTKMPDTLWQRLNKLIPQPPPSSTGGRPRLDPRRVADGIYYIMRTGCQWKAVPNQFPSGSSLHRYFQEWCESGVFLKLWKQALEEYDRRRGIAWRWMSIDTATTKAPLGGEKTGPNPTDRGKLGAKRSVLTDGRGVVLGIAIGPANQHDVKLAIPTLDSIPVRRPQPRPWHRQHLCLDKAYISDELRRTLKRRHYLPHVKSRGDERSAYRKHPHAKARRWVVERTLSWFHRFRRVQIRWEKKAINYYSELMFVAAWIAFRAARVLG